MAAERQKLRAAGGDGIGEGLGYQQAALQRIAHRLEAGDLVHRRADDGKIEARMLTDIAVGHFAEMERDVERHGGLAGGAAFIVQF